MAKPPHPVPPADLLRLPAVDAAVSRYRRSLRQGTSPCRADGDIEAQAENLRRALERNELSTRVLAEFSIPPGFRLPYRNFCLHLDKLSRRHSGRTLEIRVRLAIDRWSAAGLDPAILAALCRQTLGLNLN